MTLIIYMRIDATGADAAGLVPVDEAVIRLRAEILGKII